MNPIRAALIRRRLPLTVRPFMAMRMFHGSTTHHSDQHKDESYEEYTQRFLAFFRNEADDLFELSRGLNNAFSVDIIPAPEVLAEAMQACRRLNSFPHATRMLEALRERLDDEKIYQEYLQALKPTMDELGVPSPEALGR